MFSINAWMENPNINQSQSVQNWLVKELKILDKGISCYSKVEQKYGVKYKVCWESDDKGTIYYQKFKSLIQNPTEKKITQALNTADADIIISLIQWQPECIAVNNRIKFCCKVANKLEKVDKNYSWEQTLDRSKL